MGVMTVLVILAGLWASVAVVALVALAGVHLAERAGWRRDEPEVASDRASLTSHLA